jgi:hypothetical protein
MSQIRLTDENDRRLRNVQAQNPTACVMSLAQLTNIAVRDWLDSAMPRVSERLNVPTIKPKSK